MAQSEITELKEFLDFKSDQYNRPAFIDSDPVSIPRLFDRREDIEIAGLLAAVISWGNRKAILSSAGRMMELMGHTPFAFVMDHKPAQLDRLQTFVHRTFNGGDLIFFIKALQRIYRAYPGMEDVFLVNSHQGTLQPAIHGFRNIFFGDQLTVRTSKHLPDPMNGSAAKRINMFLRWMVRRDNRGVDFGLWTRLSPSVLSCPLDVHSGNVARKLGLLERKTNDAKAVEELDRALRILDPADPVKYDFALFGLGVFEHFSSGD